MKILKKLFPEIYIFPLLTVAYFLTRLTNLMSLPIFTDEAIYVRWAQIARFDSAWRFISLVDGKQPLLIWVQMVFIRFIEDPLLAGRLVSVFSGFLTVIGLYFLTLEVFSGKEKTNSRIIAVVSSFIAVIYPFSLVYDRLAIYESMVAAFFVWALYFQIQLVRRLRFDLSMVLGFVLGGGVLTKSSAFLSIYLTPFLLLLFDFRKKDLKNRLFKFFVYFLVSAIIANAMYSVLRLSPNFHMINQKNQIFVYSVGSWLALSMHDKIAFFQGNAMGLVDWFLRYFSIPFLALVIYSFFANKSFIKEKIVLVLWFLLPFLSLCVFGKTLYPRYVLFMSLPLIPLVSLSIYELFKRYKNTLVRLLVVLFAFAMPIWMDAFILFNFARAPIPRLDLEQFINGWPSGGGVKESVEFFKEKSQNGQIMIGTQGTFGLMPAAYELYFRDNPNVRINGFWPIEGNKVPDLLLDYAKRIPTYIVFYQPCPDCSVPGAAPSGMQVTEVASYKKGVGKTKLTVYQVIPQSP